MTGVFTWLVNRQPGIKIGDVAGTLRDDGYIRIQIDGIRLYASHWAFLYMTGRLPENEIDHEDKRRANNIWSNLREATKSENCANRRCATGVIGLKGVTPYGNGRFKAQIRVRGEPRYLGLHDTAEAAHEAYKKAAQESFGDFANIVNDNKPAMEMVA